MLEHLWHRCLSCNCNLWQAGEGPGIRRGAREPAARPGPAPEEAAEGAELWILPAQNAGAQVRTILPDRYLVYHIPWCLHVRHPPGSQVRLGRRMTVMWWDLPVLENISCVSTPQALTNIWFVMLLFQRSEVCPRHVYKLNGSDCAILRKTSARISKSHVDGHHSMCFSGKAVNFSLKI